jgi:hypothetical protein
VLANQLATASSAPIEASHAQYTVVLDEAEYIRDGSESAQHQVFRVAEVEIVLEAPTVSQRQSIRMLTCAEWR